MAVVDPQDSVVFPAIPRVRRRGQFWMLAGLGAAGYAAFHAATDAMPGDRRLILLAVAAGFAIGGVLIGRAYRRMRVVITDDEVVVHNWGTEDRFPFDEVAGFEPERNGRPGAPPLPVTVLRLTRREHGIPRSVQVAALTWPGRDRVYGIDGVGLNALKPTIDELNAELDRRRPEGPSAAERIEQARPNFHHDDAADAKRAA